jgi:hypothetical protein
MGLDNMPMVYPCVKEKTAIMDDGRIDCEATQKANQCPYKREKESDPLTKDMRSIYGMFGTDCWYRGKYGNNLLSKMRNHNPEFPYDEDGFYGDIDYNEEKQGGISEDECQTMSEVMINFTESWIHYVDTKGTTETGEERENLINDWLYAAWWLKFVGNYGEGSGVWY